MKVSSLPRRFFSQMTKGDLFKYQDALPSLPVPELQKTLDLYKQSIKPFYSNGEKDIEFKKYCQVIDEFGSSSSDAGVKLQSKLESFASDKRNWLSAFWDDYAYLDYRDPVSPFVSYFYSHKQINSPLTNDQFLKSTAIIIKTLQFMTAIENESLEPEMIKNAPFCMESFKWMFNNCRIPGKSSDYNLKFNGADHRFMIVISNGYFFKLQTHDLTTDQILPFNKIYHSLLSIHQTSIKRGPNPNPIGILSSSNRDVWYDNYTKLVNLSIKNKSNFDDIFKSSFVLCLDDNLPITIESKSRNCWHGNGTNRYFDKPIQMFVSRNGSSGFLGEHSKMDGTPTLTMNNWLINEIEKNFEISDNDLNVPINAPVIKELHFDINTDIKEQINKEIQTFDKVTNSLDIKTWQYFGFGKNDIKALNCSPDSFVQMLIQLAYYKYTGTLRPTYESASTRKYFKGRTETCRSVSQETLKFVSDWEHPLIDNEQKIKSFRAALKSHGNYIRLASAGLGVDRHLFGLKQMIDSNDADNEIIHEFFNNPIFNYSQKWYLSTSQLSSENFNGYGWSPVIPEGFGLAYMINNNWLHINITNFKENAFDLNVEEMAYYLTKSLNELREILKTETLKPKL